MSRKLIPILENIPHRIYVEPFGGGASVLLAKRPVPVEVYNDLNHALYDFFMILADPKLFAEFYRRVEALPYSRELYNECRAEWQNHDDRIERVWRWFVVARQSFSGDFARSWSSAVTASRRGMAGTCSKWISAIHGLPEVHARLQRVQIENADFRTILDRYNTDSSLMYMDPPYVQDTRKSGKYKHEMSALDHIEMVDMLLKLKGSAVLSGYASPVYDRLSEAGWVRKDWQTSCYAAGRTRGTGVQGQGSAMKMQSRTESVWIKGGGNGMLFEGVL